MIFTTKKHEELYKQAIADISEIEKIYNFTSFKNENRERRYGLRVGDMIVWNSSLYMVYDIWGVDNNNVNAIGSTGKKVALIAEHCKIVTKIETLPFYI